jgi:hypothetical protein
MYAASASTDASVQIILKAGADPNQSSPHGDTALMVAALSGWWNDELVKAGARVDARNSDGQTALMILAIRGNPNGIRDALKAGTDPSLKDAKGRTALDYLRQASCGKSPVYDPVEDDGGIIFSRCTVIDADDLRKAEKLLLDAMHKKASQNATH